MGTGRVVECGVWVEDIISDFAGVVTGVAHYINGCTSCKVESSTRKEDGEVIEQWFDVRRLRPADKDPIVLGSSAPSNGRGNGVGFCPK